jgi:serine protease inhibitor ecotin
MAQEYVKQSPIPQAYRGVKRMAEDDLASAKKQIKNRGVKRMSEDEDEIASAKKQILLETDINSAADRVLARKSGLKGVARRKKIMERAKTEKMVQEYVKQSPIPQANRGVKRMAEDDMASAKKQIKNRGVKRMSEDEDEIASAKKRILLETDINSAADRVLARKSGLKGVARRKKIMERAKTEKTVKRRSKQSPIPRAKKGLKRNAPDELASAKKHFKRVSEDEVNSAVDRLIAKRELKRGKREHEEDKVILSKRKEPANKRMRPTWLNH